LRVDGRANRFRSRAEREEERVAVDAHLVRRVAKTGIPEHTPVQFQPIGVPVLAEPVQQPGRPFHVREEHRDRPGRLSRHRATIARRRPFA
jgi:hypothetical protein